MRVCVGKQPAVDSSARLNVMVVFFFVVFSESAELSCRVARNQTQANRFVALNELLGPLFAAVTAPWLYNAATRVRWGVRTRGQLLLMFQIFPPSSAFTFENIGKCCL